MLENLLIFYVSLCFSGPVVMNMSGYSEKGFKRKLAVQALFGKVFYLSEVSNQTVCLTTFYQI